jgi:hypothetical protein
MADVLGVLRPRLEGLIALMLEAVYTSDTCFLQTARCNIP